MTPAEWLESQPLEKPYTGLTVFTRRMIELIDDTSYGFLSSMQGRPSDAGQSETFQL